jgi:hypothetical protein
MKASVVSRASKKQDTVGLACFLEILFEEKNKERDRRCKIGQNTGKYGQIDGTGIVLYLCCMLPNWTPSMLPAESENDGEDCPDLSRLPYYLTMCDNHAEGEGGFDYCTNAPDYI